MGVKERPILFSGPMVRAILDGRKTQTRRVAKLTSAGHVKEPRGHRRWHPGDPEAAFACPYGQPGDRLWVRETWWRPIDFWTPAGCWKRGCRTQVRYAADDEVRSVDIDREQYDKLVGMKAGKRPSIHMPRWASRITLEVESVRVDKVQDISEDDIDLEGVHCPRCRGCGVVRTYGEGGVLIGDDCPYPGCGDTSVPWFRELWDSTNAKRGVGWDANPWVWVVGFKVAL